MIASLVMAAAAAAPAGSDAWEALLSRHAAAKSLSAQYTLRIEGAVVDEAGDPEELGRYQARLALGRPFAGGGRVEDPDGNAVLELGSDGTRWYSIDRAHHTYRVEPANLGSLWSVPQLAPFQAFLGADVPEPASVTSRPGEGGGQTVAVDLGDKQEEYDLGPDGSLRSARHSYETRDPQVGRVRVTYHYDLTAWTLSADSNLAPQPPPSEFEEIGSDWEVAQRLLPKGTPVPDLHVQTLDGGQLALSELRGKTVLLNFWFYH